MPEFVLNKHRQVENNNNFEVHVKNPTACRWFPKDFIDLGTHSNCVSAVALAKQWNPNLASSIDACATCCRSCDSDRRGLRL